MNRLIRIGILWCLAISISSAQEADTSKDEANQHNRGEPQASASSKAIVLVIDADVQKSEVVKEVIAALEKAGIATGKAAETAPPTNSPISVTLSIRNDESSEKIKLLIEALSSIGVRQISFRKEGVTKDGEEEQNVLILDAQPGYTTDELHKFDNAARTAAKQCGLPLVVVTRGQEPRAEGEFFPNPENTQRELPKPDNSSLGVQFQQSLELRQAQAKLRNAQLKLSQLRLQFNDQHPSVKAQELQIQAMESQLQPREELLDTLQGVRSELVEKNEAARKENGSQNTETARLETLIAQLDARIKSVEGALEPATEKVASVKVFALKYAQATDAAEVLKQVYDRGPLKIVPDARTNSVIVTAPEAQVKEIEALLLKLDEAPSAANTDKNLPAPVEHMEYKETHPKFVPLNVEAKEATSEEYKQQLAQLQTDYEAANQRAHDLAESLRQTPDAAKQAELRAAVQRAFTARQSLLRAELIEMQTRLLKTQRSIDIRERISDQIIQRRVEDLLNPELKWQSSESPETSPGHVARAGSQGGANSSDGVEIHGDIVVPFEHDGLSTSGVRVLDEPDENGMVLVTFQPSPHSSLERLEVGQKVYVSQTLRPIMRGSDHTPIIASGCILKEFWANRQRSASNQPVDLLVPQRQVEELIEAEKRGALEVHEMRKAGHDEIKTSGTTATPIEDSQDAASVGEGTPVDEPKQAMLDKLQGYWDFQELSVENPEPRSFPNGPQMIYEIRGNRMASLPNEPYMPTWHLQFGEPGIPQPIELIASPDHAESPGFLGIIEITEDVVRICSNNSGGANAKRPTEFAVTKDTDILELRRRPAPVTELEGDWHVVAYYDHEGKPQETLPSNRSFRGDQSSFVRPGYRHDCRIKVDPIKKTLWSYSKEEDGSFGQDYYELKGNQLILRNEPGAVGYQVLERGLVRIPSVVPPATPEQKLLWRSAIVEIAIYPSIVSPRSQDELVIGRGIVISSDGMILSQFPVSEDGDFSQTNIKAKFDDGSMIPLKLIEKAGQGWAVLQPEQPIDVNHFFEVSTTEAQLHDEVRVWGPHHSQAGSESLAPFASTVSALERKYPALGIAVWQLRIGHRPVPGTPILDADGDLLGMTITGARDLLLAIPVAELKTMFPKSFGQPSESEPQPVEALPDWLSELQGTWTVTESPLFVDENSGGQMKEIRIDRDHLSIVWMAKPGEPDRVESLRAVQPDEKNVYAIDLVELSTGKVVYPSLYELDQAGLTFCYGYRGERPDEISTGNRGITIRLTRDE